MVYSEIILKTAAIAMAVILSACSGEGAAVNAEKDAVNEKSMASISQPSSIEINHAVKAPAQVQAMPVRTIVRTTKADGKTFNSNSAAAVDSSNISQGYVMVKYTGDNHKVKLQITGPNKVTYTYNLKKGDYEAFPLTSGDGSYTVNVFENVKGTTYAQAYGTTVNVTLQDPLLPFLHPSQYVSYTAETETVAKGAELAAGAANELEIVERVFNYVSGNISYDYDKAATVQSGYLPSVDQILNIKKGICFDYSAVMATMLRTQNIPTRLEVGYVSDGTYHAWISVYIKDKGWINGIIQFDGNKWKRMDPTFMSQSKGSEEMYDFIADEKNYTVKYMY